MADITIKAAYGSVVEDEGQLFIGFAAGEQEEEGYVLFRQAIAGGPVWFEVNDAGFGAEEAVEQVQSGPKGLEIMLKSGLAGQFGWAASVAVRIAPGTEDAGAALQALARMLGPRFQA